MQPTSGLSGYTYTWNWPPGWIGTSDNGTTITVYPDGVSAGNISVVAKAFGVESTPGTLTIPLQIIEPSTSAYGSNDLCNDAGSTYSLSPGLQNCTSVSWSVSPANAVTTATGTGSNASLSAASNYNGNATITYTINTPCGTATRSKTFFVGRPIINDIILPPCLNRYTTYNFSVSAQGGNSYTWGVPSCNIPSNDPGWWDPSCWHIMTVMPANNPYVKIYAGEKDGVISAWVTNQCGTVSMGKPIIWCNPQEPGPGPKYPFTGGGEVEDRSLENEYKTDIFKLYPNPVTGQLTLEFLEDKFEDMISKNISIFSLKGEEVSNEVTAAKVYIKDVAHYPNGTYFVKVQVGSKTYDATFIKIE